MTVGFPHSDISGSKVIWHLPETYRSHITSFIASWSQGIHHTPFVPIGNAIHRCIIWVSPGDTYSGLCVLVNACVFRAHCVFACRGRKDLSCEKLLTRHALPVRASQRSWLARNLPTGRRFHGRTFRRQILSICPLEYAIFNDRVPPWNLDEKNRDVAARKSRGLSCYDVAFFSNFINTWALYYRKRK